MHLARWIICCNIQNRNSATNKNACTITKCIEVFVIKNKKSMHFSTANWISCSDKQNCKYFCIDVQLVPILDSEKYFLNLLKSNPIWIVIIPFSNRLGNKQTSVWCQKRNTVLFYRKKNIYSLQRHMIYLKLILIYCLFKLVIFNLCYNKYFSFKYM